MGTPVDVEGASLEVYAGDDDAAVGQPAPVVEGVSPDGEPVVIGGDGPQILVFLAHWCPHCQAEVPRVVSATESAEWPEDVEVVGITTATDSNRSNYPPSEWLEGEGWDAAVLADDQDTGAAAAYGLAGFPFLVFVDADGDVALRTSGEMSEDDFLALAQQLAAGEPLSAPGTGESSPA